MSRSLSASQAIACGLLVVNGPVLMLLVGPLWYYARLIDRHMVSRDYNWVGLPMFLASFVLAWLWWSLTIARWRVWAYERVDDRRSLKEQAVAVGLTWPEGHVFAKTEIKSPALAKRQQELDPPEAS